MNDQTDGAATGATTETAEQGISSALAEASGKGGEGAKQEGGAPAGRSGDAKQDGAKSDDGAKQETARDGKKSDGAKDDKQDDKQDGGAKADGAKSDGKKDDSGEKETDPDEAPITDFSKADLTLRGDVPLDRELYESFGKNIVEKYGLSKKLAQEIVNLQMDHVANRQKAYDREQATALSKAWGRNEEANKKRVLSLLGRVDRIEGLEDFSKIMGDSGATGNALILRGLCEIAKLLEEDGTGAAGAGADAGAKEETAIEGIRDALRRARED